MDLLDMAGRRPELPMVVTCSSRDELDAVCSAVSSLPFLCLSVSDRTPPLVHAVLQQGVYPSPHPPRGPYAIYTPICAL